MNITSENLSNQKVTQDKKVKSVQFLNEIEIIVDESPMVHVFPQYNVLASGKERRRNNEVRHNHMQQR